MKFKIEVDIDIVEEFQDSESTIARIYYPDEGNKIEIRKGLNTLTVFQSIHHEIGHLLDWYLGQSTNADIRESNAIVIGDALKYVRKKRTLKTWIIYIPWFLWDIFYTVYRRKGLLWLRYKSKVFHHGKK